MMRYGALLSLALTGCGSIPEGRFACATDDDCPSRWFCRANRCYSRAPVLDGGADGGPRDASIDAGPDASIDAGPEPDGGSCNPALTQWDTYNCGACGNRCSGYCSQGSCTAGYPLMIDSVILNATVAASLVDVVARGDEECFALNWVGDILIAGATRSSVGGLDAMLFCRDSGIFAPQSTADDDIAQSITLLDGGPLFGGITGLDAFLRFSDGGLSWAATISSGSQSDVRSLDTDESGRAYAGGQVFGTTSVSPPVDQLGGAYGNGTSNENGFVLRIPSRTDPLDLYLSVDDRNTGGQPQSVWRVAAHAGLLAVCGSYTGTIDAKIRPVTDPAPDDNAFVALYDVATNTPRWTAVFGGTGGQYCAGLDIDGQGRVYAGIDYASSLIGPGGLDETTSGMTDVDTLVVALDPTAGAFLWRTQISPVIGEQHIADLRVDEVGNVFVAGNANGMLMLPGELPDSYDPESGFIVSLDQRGEFRWAQRVGVRLAGPNDFARVQGIDVAERSGGRSILVAASFQGNLIQPTASVAALPVGLYLDFYE